MNSGTLGFGTERGEAAPIVLTKRQARSVKPLIDRWVEENVIAEATAATLRQSLVVATFDWLRLARLAILVSTVCIAIAVVSILADDWIIRLLTLVFGKVEIALCVLFAILASGFFAGGFYRKRNRPERTFTNEGLLFLGVLCTAASIYFLGIAIGGGRDFSPLLLLACGIYGLLGLTGNSKLVWVFALLALGAWFGVKTAYEWGAYFLGMNHPLRFVLVGIAICASSFIVAQVPRTRALAQSTMTVGMLYLFVALWMLSIFGNYDDLSQGYAASRAELFHWSILFGVAAGCAIWHGLKFDNLVSHGFGLAFLFINIYTRFFENFWEPLHKGAFFAVLGVSLWVLGANAERIWNFGRARELQDDQQSTVWPPQSSDAPEVNRSGTSEGGSPEP